MYTPWNGAPKQIQTAPANHTTWFYNRASKTDVGKRDHYLTSETRVIGAIWPLAAEARPSAENSQR